MSRSYWIAGVASVAATFLALLVVFVFLDLTQYRQQQIDQRASSTAYYTHPTREQSNSLDATHSGIADLARHIEQADSAQEHERYTHNLQAQQDVALFTRALAWAAGIGILVSGVGVGLIFETLRATRDLTKETQRIGEAQTRAYVAIGEVKIKIPVAETALRSLEKGMHVPPEIRIEVWNNGNSPATRFAHIVNFKYMTFEVLDDTHISTPRERVSPRHDIRQVDVDILDPRTIPPKSPIEIEYTYGFSLDSTEMIAAASDNQSRQLVVYVAIQTRFEDVFETVWYDERGFVCFVDRELLGDFQPTSLIDPRQTRTMQERIEEEGRESAN
jgi:hypothetical protein